MSYDPDEHAVAGRQVAAGWVVCLVIIGLALGVAAKHEPASQTMSVATWQIATTGYRDPPSGAHIPRFVQHCSTRLDKRPLDMAEARPNAASSPIGNCG